MSITLQTKRPAESRLYNFEFAGKMLTGEEISGTPTVTATPSSPALTVGSATASGTIAQVRLSGGTDGVWYDVLCTVTTNQGNTLQLLGRLEVKDGVTAIIATAGGATSNCYVTLAEANTYFTTKVGGSAWFELEENDAESALITATAQLEQRKYVGGKTDTTQALKWPRWGVEDEEGVAYASDVIPAPVKKACFELALSLGENPDGLGTTGLEGFKSIQLSQEVKFDLVVGGSTAGSLPSQVTALIADFLLGDQARVLRA